MTSTPASKVPEAYRKKLKPRRSIAGSASPQDPKKLGRWIATHYPKKRYRSWKKTWSQLFASGIASAKRQEKTLTKARDEAHALLTQFDIAKLAALSLETLSVAERMVWYMSGAEESLTPAIVHARGLTDAVRVAAQASRYEIATPNGHMEGAYVSPSTTLGYYPRDPCAQLRHLVCAASKKDYEDARRVAETLRKKPDQADRVFLSYVFPDEPWSAQDLNDALKAASAAAGNTGGVRGGDHHRVASLLSATDDVDVVRRWIDVDGPFRCAQYAVNLATALPAKDAVAIFADALTKLLVRPKYGPLHKTPPRDIAEGLSCIDTKEAAAVLASYATNAILGPMVLAYFRDHPERGALLEAQAKGKGKKLEATTARVLGKRDDDVALVPAAKSSDLPPVLRDAPWRASKSGTKWSDCDGSARSAMPRAPHGRGSAKKKGSAAPVVIKGVKMLGLELEKVKLVREPTTPVDDDLVRPMTKAELAAWKADVENDKYSNCDYQHAAVRGSTRGYEYLRVPDRDGLWAWNEKNAYVSRDLEWVKKHGVAIIPGFVKRDWIRWLNYLDEGGELFLAVLSIISPRIAPKLARVAARRKRFRRIATNWLIEHPEVSAYGLIPDAVSDSQEQRHDAEASLLSIARHGHDAIVRKVAKKYGKDIERAIIALLERDPLATDASVPKRPPFLRLDDLPQVKLVGGKRSLDSDALSSLIEMLQMTTIDEPYPGIPLVREACDATSLGDLAIELLEQWVIGDAPGRHEWMLAAVVHLPSERGIRRVAELAREWARKNQAKALRACTALAADGSDVALMHLAHIAETTRFAALKKDAAELVSEAAGERGLSTEELGDRTVPDAGLGPDGTITLSYGAREFVVGLDPSLHPSVREKTKGSGKLAAPAKTIPRPAKTDDEAKARDARERFDQLKKDLEAIAQRQVRRLERAMVLGRSWSVADFEARIATHPLLRHIARALVWEIVSNKPRSFRIAEDGSRADESDKKIDLPAKAMIRIAHPARTPDLAKKWSTIFADYEIVQPFEQLGRAVFEPTAAETKAKDLARAVGLAVPARKLLGTMESRGWRRDSAGHVSAWLRELASRDGELLDVAWSIKPGISMEDLRHAPDVTTEELVARRKDGKPATLGVIDPVAFSEIVRDIEAVRNL